MVLGIVIGGVVGVWAWKNNTLEFSIGLMQVIVCAHRLMGQFISFCVPIIVLGFICPSITKLGQNAGKLLGVALVIAYLSSVFAATMSAVAGYTLVPILNIESMKAFERDLPKAIFTLDIPQIMPVITALVLSIVFGLSAVWTNSKTIMKQLMFIVLGLM